MMDLEKASHATEISRIKGDESSAIFKSACHLVNTLYDIFGISSYIKKVFVDRNEGKGKFTQKSSKAF